jgi:isochorismate synthase
MSIFDTIESHFQLNLPFVAYCKPNATAIIGLFQRNDNLYLTTHYNEVGFVFAPFDIENSCVIIPESESEMLQEPFVASNEFNTATIDFSPSENKKKAHIQLVQKGIDAIHSGQFSKLVLSRKETVSFTKFDLIATFKRILSAYPSAYKYCWFHPKVGLWMGGFSEQLLQVEKQVFQTMAVAGTQFFEGNEPVIWQKKEKEEQQLVTDFIVEKLENKVTHLSISTPYTMKAGKVLHLKTDIQADLKATTKLKDLLTILHPTPAVCGLPKVAAKEFILENENYNREFYSGFLGEMNKNFSTNEICTNLYVNLRCMKIDQNQAHLYIGGGITKDSIPEKEWEETVHKSKTMKNILTS